MSELLNMAFVAPGGPEFLFILLVLLLLFWRSRCSTNLAETQRYDHAVSPYSKHI